MTDFIRNEERVMKDGKLVEIKYEIKKEQFAAWYGEQWLECLSDVLMDIEDDITKHYPGIYGLPVALALRKLEDTLINNKRIPNCVYVTNEELNLVCEGSEWVFYKQAVTKKSIIIHVNTEYFYGRYGEDWNSGMLQYDYRQASRIFHEFPNKEGFTWLLAYRQLIEDYMDEDVPDTLDISAAELDAICKAYKAEIASWQRRYDNGV
jgi:hypothetical protein